MAALWKAESLTVWDDAVSLKKGRVWLLSLTKNNIQVEMK